MKPYYIVLYNELMRRQIGPDGGGAGEKLDTGDIKTGNSWQKDDKISIETEIQITNFIYFLILITLNYIISI